MKNYFRKIKDNVDMVVLENYGYMLNEEDNCWYYLDNMRHEIDNEDRYIRYVTYSYSTLYPVSIPNEYTEPSPLTTLINNNLVDYEVFEDDED